MSTSKDENLEDLDQDQTELDPSDEDLHLDTAAEATDEFENEQIDQILASQEKKVQNILFGIKNPQDEVSIKTTSSYVSQGVGGPTGGPPNPPLTDSADEFDDLVNEFKISGFSDLITFSELFNSIKKFAFKGIDKTLSLTENVSSTVQLSLYDKIKLATSKYLLYCDAGLIFLPVAGITLFGFGTAYSMWCLRSNVFKGFRGAARYALFFNRLYENDLGWVPLGVAPYVFLSLLYQQRKFENDLIFSSLRKKTTANIKNSLLCKTIVHNALLSSFGKHKRRETAPSNVTFKGVEDTPTPNSNPKLTSILSQWPKRPTEKKIICPDTEDWDSVSDSPNKSHAQDKSLLSLGKLLPEDASDLNPLKDVSILSSGRRPTEAEIENKHAANLALKNYNYNIYLKTKEEHGSLRILSDLGWSMMLMPVVSNMISSTGIWDATYSFLRDLFKPQVKSYFGELKDELFARHVGSWKQFGLSLLVAMAIKSTIRVQAVKSLLK